MKNNKKLLVIGIIAIVLVMSISVGLTYAFFTAGVEGNDTANETEITAGTLRVRLTDTEVMNFDNAYPGREETKTFTVENTGDAAASYNISLIDVASTFIGSEIVYTLTSNNDGGVVTETTIPTTDTVIVENIVIDTGVTQTYTLTIKFLETGLDRNSNQGAGYTAKVQIVPTHIGGLLAGYLKDSNGDVMANTKMSLHSDPVETTTNADGYYEFKNVPAGEHTINVLNNSNEVVASKNVTVKLSNETNIEGSILKASPTLTKYVNVEVSNAIIDIIIQKINETLYDKIISIETPVSDASINFANSSYVNGDAGLYYTADATTYGEDGERIYYYRGDIDNNWVSFGGYYWRIVRTTAEGGIKLAYSGGNVSIGVSSLTSSSASIYNTIENTSATIFSPNKSKYYAGYTYNANLNQWDGIQTNSNIKTVIDTWYNTTAGLTLSEKKYLSETAIFCADKSEEKIIGEDTYFPIYTRLEINKRPTFACNKANGSRYTVIANSANGNNGYLTYPVAMLSADEIYYAGLTWNTNTGVSTTPYILDNADYYFYTMSPYMYSGSLYASNHYTYSSGAYLSYTSSTNWQYARPAVALKSCITVTSGDGSVEHPYELSNSAC